MEFKKTDFDVDAIVKNIKKGKYIFDFSIQRSEGQWNKEQKSLFIHTLAGGYIVPPIYILKEDSDTYNKSSVLDGKQRLTTIISYMNDDFKLTKNLDPVRIFGTEYTIANKKWSELDEKVKEAILDHEMMVCQLIDYTDEEIEEQFYRFNNGSTFTKQQKAICTLGDELATKLKSVSENAFFERCKITHNQRVRGVIEETILKSLMLTTDWNFKSFSSGEVEKFAEHLNGLDSDKKHEVKIQLDNINGYLTKLNECILSDDEIDVFLKPLNIPCLVYLCKEHIELGTLTDDEFSEMIMEFISNPTEEYLKCCGAGSSHKEKVNGRKDILINLFYETVDKKENANNDNTDDSDIDSIDNTDSYSSLNNTNDTQSINCWSDGTSDVDLDDIFNVS